MKILKNVILFFLLIILWQGFTTVSISTSKSILDKMIAATKDIKNLRYNLHSIERVNNKFLAANTEIKMIVEPCKIYLKNPKKKLEVLFIDGENNNKAMVNTGKFILPVLHLNPNEALMRKEQHHTLGDLGFNYFINIISKNVSHTNSSFDDTFIYLGIEEYHGRKCHKIYYKNKDFKYFDYTIQKNETIRSISNKFSCGDYRIHEKNPSLSLTENLKEGTVISVPNGYGINTLLYIDTILNLPAGIITSDDMGLYESYIFSDIIVNSPFAKEEFDKNYKGYNF